MGVFGSYISDTYVPTIGLATVIAPSGDASGATDTATITNALNLGNNVYFTPGTYFSTGGHVQDIGKQLVDLNGAQIDFTPMSAGGTAWKITATVGGNGVNAPHQRYYLGHGRFYTTRTGVGVSTGKGLEISATAEPAAAFVTVRNMVVQYFDKGFIQGSNSYNIDFDTSTFDHNNTNVSVPSGLTNAAEVIAFHGGAIIQGQIGIDHQGANTVVKTITTRLDGNVKYVNLVSAIMEMDMTHNEILNAASITADAPFTLSGASLLKIHAGEVMGQGSPPFNFNGKGVFDIGVGSEVYIDGEPLMNNLQNTTGQWYTGAGRMTFASKTFTFNINAIPLISGPQENLLEDPLFAAATIVDDIFIISDSVSPVISRLSGSNIILTTSALDPSPGATQSLRAQKIGGVGTNAGFCIAFPVRPGMRLAMSGNWATSAGVTGSIFSNGRYQKLVYGSAYSAGLGSALNNLPIELVGSTSVGTTLTPIGVTYTRWTSGPYNPPAWATHVSFFFNMNAMSAGDFYLGTLLPTWT